MSRLGQLLYTIIDEAGLNQLKVNNRPPLKTQLEKFRDGFINKRITSEIPLYDYYHFSWSDTSINFARQKLQNPFKTLKHRWPKTLKPFIIFSSITPTIQSNGFFNQFGNFIDVKRDISLPSSWISREKSGPYLILVSAVIGKEDSLEFRDAFAMPILSTQELIPLESGYERSVLKTTIGSLKSTGRSNLTIKKPLFCLHNEQKERYRPDFIISDDKGHSIFVEVLGSRNEDYLDQKWKISKIAKENCNFYLSVRGYELHKEHPHFIKVLTQAISQFPK